MKAKSNEREVRVAKTLHIQNRESKPGVYYITRQTREIILEIKLRNSVERTGRIATEGQRDDMLREMEVATVIARKEGRTADLNFLVNQCDKIKKKKLSKVPLFQV